MRRRVICTDGKIYTPIFSFFRRKFANIVFLELGLVSNERSGNSTFYRGIPKFLNPSIIEKIAVFLFYAVVDISQKVL